MILVGTAGYSYPDWIGPVYPEGIKKGEMLEYYAQEFEFTEINSTYYGMPNKYMVWNRIETRTIQVSSIVKDFVQFPHVEQAARLHYVSTDLKGMNRKEETRYLITSLPSEKAGVKELLLPRITGVTPATLTKSCRCAAWC